MSPPANVARIIRRVRKRMALTQQEFATQLGVALPTVSRWENKRYKPSPLAMDKVESLLRGMGRDGEDLLEKYFKKTLWGKE